MLTIDLDGFGLDHLPPHLAGSLLALCLDGRSLRFCVGERAKGIVIGEFASVLVVTGLNGDGDGVDDDIGGDVGFLLSVVGIEEEDEGFALDDIIDVDGGFGFLLTEEVVGFDDFSLLIRLGCRFLEGLFPPPCCSRGQEAR